MKRLLLISLLLPFFTIAQTGCISGDCVNGYGTYVWKNGDKYVGEHKNGVSHGQGTYIYGEGKWLGDKYVGEYQNDKRHGQGTYISSDGTKTSGEWKNDEFID